MSGSFPQEHRPAQELPWLEELLTAMEKLPSWENLPATSVVVLTEPADRDWLAGLTECDWPRQAAVGMVFCLDYFALKQTCPHEAGFALAGLAGFIYGVGLTTRSAQAAAQAAEKLGLSCIFLPQALGEAPAVRTRLQLPPYVFPVTALLVTEKRIGKSRLTGVKIHRGRYREPAAAELAAAAAWWEEEAGSFFRTRVAGYLAAKKMAAALVQAGFTFTAAAALGRIVRTQPSRRSFFNRTGVQLRLAQLALFAGRIEGGVKLLHAAMAAEPAAADIPAALAVVYQYQGSLDKAVSLLEQATARAPGNAYLIHLLGTVYQQQGQDGPAAACFRRAVEIDPKLKPAWLALAQVLEAGAGFAEAAAVYEEARAAIGPDVTLLNNEGLCLSNLGRRQEAARLYREALKLTPDDPVILGNLALLLGQEGQFDPALAYYNRALRRRPRDPNLLNNKGFCLGKLGRYEEALRCYELALRVEGDDLNLLHNKASCLTRLGRYKEALACYDQVLQLNPTDTGMLNNRGLCLMALNRMREASECFNLALKLEPNNAVYWGNKGACLFKQGKYQEALAAYERALALTPEELVYYSGKGMCLDYLGRAEEAVDCYNRALRLA